ncbi:MAG: hypothetical protein J0H82_30200 [Alphaproteobacteria bacterium]|nr:hypothetical protein [Alphaproteobacteria bacterium]
MARSGGTYVYNPETGADDLVPGSQTRMPSLEERRAMQAAETAAGDDPPAQPARKLPRAPSNPPRRDREGTETSESSKE